LCDATAKAASQFAYGCAVGQLASASAVALAQEVLRSMFLNKLRFTLLTLLALGVATTGAGFLGQSLGMMKPESPRPADGPPRLLAQAAPHEEVNPGPAPGRMIVAGRVLDPTGKPVPNATTMLYAQIKKEKRGVSVERVEMTMIGRVVADGSGRYRLEAPRTSSSRYERLGAVAIAPGYGAGWADLDPDVGQPSAEIPLRPERVIQGRLIDLQGQPARGVEVTVQSMGPIVRENRLPSRAYQERLHFWSIKVKDLPAWPKPATTDSAGRFTLHGVGRDLQVVLTIIDPRYAHERIEVVTTDPADSKPLGWALEPPKTVIGRVTYADTGKPVPHALVQVWSRKGAQGLNIPLTEYETDAEGRFRANCRPGDRIGVDVYPPEGDLHLHDSKEFDWIKTSVEHSVDLALPRGVAVRGKVTEEGTGKPVEDAHLWFLGSKARSSYALTRGDGAFQLAVAPARGLLSVRGPSDDYILQEIGERMWAEGQPGGYRAYSHAWVFLDPKPGDNTLEVDVTLRRGETLKGRAIGPDEQPIENATMISRIILEGGEGGRIWRSIYNGGAVRDGRFELHGLAPDTEVPVFFLEPRRKLGATIHVSGKSAAGGPVTVRLEPCGTAKARLVDPGG
jgi:protocatechuate 3,4-dioxygenase beta subunit